MLIDPSGNPSLAFTLYAAECEGDLDTRESKIQKTIRRICGSPFSALMGETEIRQEAAAAGIDNLTSEEINRIKTEVLFRGI